MSSLCSHLRLLFALCCLSIFGMGANAIAFETHESILKQSDWPEYVNGSNLLAIPALHDTLKRFEERQDQRIVIRYPGGDNGKNWARVVNDWLVAYGVPLAFIQTEVGSGGADQLLLIVVDENSDT